MTDSPYASDWRQVTEHKEKPLMDLFQKPGKVFVDVGAHGGRWTLPMARLFERVIAFEPNPDAYKALADNLVSAKVTGKVEARQLAVSNRRGSGQLLELDDVPSRSTFYPQYSSLKVTRYWMVNVDTLDNLLKYEEASSDNLIKVDVEGAEHDVLMGAREILEKWKPRLCVETHSDGLHNICSTFLKWIGLPFETFTLTEEAPASRHAEKGEKHKYIIRA